MRYLFNEGTKEHRLLTLETIMGCDFDAGWDVIEADADGWIEWAGGDVRPVKTGALVDVKHRDGEIYREPCGTLHSKSFLHLGEDGDIIAYRPVLDKGVIGESGGPDISFSANPDWRGPEDGLPPVGEVCEVTAHGYGGKWYRIRITAITNDHVIGYIREDRESALMYKTNGVEFRPLKTDRERWIEAAHAACNSVDDNDFVRTLMGDVFDAGLARLLGE